MKRTSAWLRIGSLLIAASLSLAVQPASAQSLSTASLPTSLTADYTEYGFIDLVGRDFDPDTQRASWELTTRTPESSSEPYIHSSTVRVVIPQQVGDLTVGKPELSNINIISPISNGTFSAELGDIVPSDELLWLNARSNTYNQAARSSATEINAAMRALLQDNPQYAIFLGSQTLWDEVPTAAFDTTVLNGTEDTWSVVASDNAVVRLVTNGESLLRDSDGDFVRLLGAVRTGDDAGTIYYQKIPGTWLQDFYNHSTANDELAFAQYVAAILPMTDTTVYETTLPAPVAASDTLPAGTAVTTDLPELADAAFNAVFQTYLSDTPELSTPLFVYNWILRGQMIGADYSMPLSAIEFGMDPQQYLAFLEQASPEEAENLRQMLPQVEAELLAKLATISETTDSNGDSWWVIDLNHYTGRLNLLIEAPVTAENAESTTQQWIPAQAYISNTCYRLEEDLNNYCVDVLPSAAGRGENTSNNPNVIIDENGQWSSRRDNNADGALIPPQYTTDSGTRDLTRGLLSLAQAPTGTDFRSGIPGNQFCMATRNITDPLKAAKYATIATDFDEPFEGLEPNSIGNSAGQLRAGDTLFSIEQVGEVTNRMIWIDDGCDQAAARANVVSEPEETNAEESSSEESSSADPSSEEPSSAESSSEEPSSEESSSAAAISDEPTSEGASSEEPTTVLPASDEPSAAESTSEEAPSEEPTSALPSPDASITEEPSTEEAPSTVVPSESASTSAAAHNPEPTESTTPEKNSEPSSSEPATSPDASSEVGSTEVTVDATIDVVINVILQHAPETPLRDWAIELWIAFLQGKPLPELPPTQVVVQAPIFHNQTAASTQHASQGTGKSQDAAAAKQDSGKRGVLARTGSPIITLAVLAGVLIAGGIWLNRRNSGRE